MSVRQQLKSHILISGEIEHEVECLEEQLSGFRVVKFVEDTFKIEHAKEVTAQAYITTSASKYIIMAATDFTDVAQNALLKLLEEPPKNIEFIIISPTKSNLLPTVRSRLPVIKNDLKHKEMQIDLCLSRLDYEAVFAFLKEHARTPKNEAKNLLEALFYKATALEGLQLTQRQLKNFDTAYRLLELNGRSQSILSMVLMGFVEERS